MTSRKRLAWLGLLFLIPAATAGALDGDWHGKGTISDTTVKIWLHASGGEEGPKLVVDFLIGQGMARIGDEDVKPRYEGDKLLWSIDAGSFGAFQCEGVRLAEDRAQAICKKDMEQLTVDLVRFEGNQWLSDEVQTAAGDEKQARYVQTVASLARAMAVDDFEKFDGYFVDNPKGTLPKDLYRRAFFVTMKFGQIQKIAFREYDEPGAFVTVHFAEDKRDFYVNLDEAGKIIELTYVPEPDPHFN